jgi:hypothetical protein
MGALEVLIVDLLCEMGLQKVDVKTRTGLELAGYYRPEKRWDLIVLSEGELVLAMEFKSMVGSFGKNLNNRSEEALGSATCLWTAFREGKGAGVSWSKQRGNPAAATACEPARIATWNLEYRRLATMAAVGPAPSRTSRPAKKLMRPFGGST